MIRSIGAGVMTAAVIMPAALGSGSPPWPYYYGGPMHGGAWSVLAIAWTLLFWTLAAVGAYTVARWTMERHAAPQTGPTTTPTPVEATPQDDKAVRSDT